MEVLNRIISNERLKEKYENEERVFFIYLNLSFVVSSSNRDNATELTFEEESNTQSSMYMFKGSWRFLFIQVLTGNKQVIGNIATVWRLRLRLYAGYSATRRS